MKNTWKFLFIQTILIVLWNQVIARPFVAVSLIFHKFGHALAMAISGFGGPAIRTIFENTGDKIFGAQSWLASFIIANSGYISSILFCLVVLFLKKTKVKKFLLGSITIIYIVFSILFPSSIGVMTTSLIFSAIVILILMIQKDVVYDLMLDIIGMSMVAYVIYDTFVDTILLMLNSQLSLVKSWSTQPAGDIVRLAELTGFPVIAWALIWLAIAVALVNILLIKVVPKK